MIHEIDTVISAFQIKKVRPKEIKSTPIRESQTFYPSMAEMHIQVSLHNKNKISNKSQVTILQRLEINCLPSQFLEYRFTNSRNEIKDFWKKEVSLFQRADLQLPLLQLVVSLRIITNDLKDLKTPAALLKEGKNSI